MTTLIRTNDELEQIKALKAEKKTVALVPTMGALHEGHLSLVEKAKTQADVVVVSIFVNPLQFGAGEDFDKYPKDLEKDQKLLEELAVDFIYAPEASEVYPKFNEVDKSKLNANDFESVAEELGVEFVRANPSIAGKLCGLGRPGHFDGVCTVVKRLFDLVEPTIALFGEKDYQQVAIIRDMVKELKIKTKINHVPIKRAESGLALSSRNQYLSKEELERAAGLYKSMNILKEDLKGLNKTVNDDFEVEDLYIPIYSNDPRIINYNPRIYYSRIYNAARKLVNKQWKYLTKAGFDIEYLVFNRNIILIAAKLGETRLIDNIRY